MRLIQAWKYQHSPVALRSVIRNLGAGVVALALWIFLFSSAAQAEVKAEVEATLEKGFARIVFEFDHMPKYTRKITGSILILSFKETVKVDLTAVFKDVTDYISIARRDPDGSAVRFAMTQRFKVNLMEAGRKLYVDILPRNWVGLPPSLPKEIIAELARISTEVEARQREEERQRELSRSGYKLKVRVGRYKTFSRIVFDWNKFVTAKMSREGAKVKLQFGVRVPTDLAELKSDPPRHLRGAYNVEADRGMAFVLSVSPEANVRGFREGMAYVVDLSAPDADLELAAKEALDSGEAIGKSSSSRDANKNKKEEVRFAGTPPPEPEPEEPPSTASDEDGKPDDKSDVDLSAEEETSGSEDLADQDLPVVDYAPAEDVASEETSSDDKKKAGNEGANEAEANKKKVAVAKAKPEAGDVKGKEPETPEKAAKGPDKKTAQGDAKTEEPKAEEPKVGKLAEAVPEDEQKAVAVPEKKTGSEPLADAPGHGLVGKGPQKDNVDVDYAKIGDGIKLAFRFKKDVSAAVFRRARTIWVVFDTLDNINLGNLIEKSGGLIADIHHVRSEGAYVLRLELAYPLLVYASKRGNSWIVEAGNHVTETAEALGLRRSIRLDQKNVVTIGYKKSSKVHWFTDPVLGDRVAVVTGFGPPRRVLKQQEFVDFQALPTAHGIAIKPHADDLAVRRRSDDVLITRRDGLTISAGTARQYVPGRKSLDKRDKFRIGFVDFQGWQQGGPAKFSSRAGELERAIALSKAKDRNPIRLELARLYLSHKLSPEVLGMVREITRVDPEANSDPAVNILRGVANTLMGRYREASKDLNVHALASNDDAALWRGVVNRRERRWDAALNDFANGSSVIGDYPHDLQAQFRLAAAAAALEVKLLNRAADELDAIPAVHLPLNLMAEAELTRGRYLEKIGRTAEAIDAYTRTIKTGARREEAQARLFTIELLMRTNKLKTEMAIKELESLSMTWRGDDTELGTLQLLANLYTQVGDYRRGFEIMSNSMKAFPGAQIAMQIQDEMKEVFRDLFLYGKGEQLAPVSSIGLFYDYRELTPVGRLGDEMIRRLADRLIAVDLLDQAAELLDHQVMHRLKGAAKAQVATKLAMIYLANRKPGLALRSLRQSRQPDLPTHTQRNRDVLEARALGELGRSAGAIDLLSRLEGDDIEKLRADVYWNAQKWKPAGEQMEKMLGGRWQDSDDLSKGERFDVLRAAISYALAEDTFALERLRKKFYPKMVRSQDAEAFVLVTKPVKSGDKSFEKIVKDIASSSTLDAFMKEFRQRLERQDGEDGGAPAGQEDRRPFG